MPDGVHWQLLRQAVVMKLKDRKTNQEIADFLNVSNFSFRKNQDEPYKKAKMDKKTVATMFADPFYPGAYKYGDNIANLNDTYNFLPLMTPDEFIALSKNMSDSFNKEFVGRSNVAKRLDFGLLREKVICDYCNGGMGFQRTQIKRGKTQVVGRFRTTVEIKSTYATMMKKQLGYTARSFQRASMLGLSRLISSGPRVI